MDPASPSPDAAAFYIQEIGALVFGLVFLFLYRQSRAVHFGLLAVAWLLQLPAAAFGLQLLRTSNAVWLVPYAAFELAFVVVLISAAGVGSAWDAWGWRTFLSLRGGRDRRIFRFAILALAVASLRLAAIAVWKGDVLYSGFILDCVLAFAAMGLWSENQMSRVREMAADLESARRDSTNRRDLDRLTGLFNQAALARRMEETGQFGGVVAVCDMDNFKEINDRYGHLVGDEILGNIGHLLQGSIRQADEAFRWGGDEFVILFHDQRAEVARNRMAEIENRLRDFQVRGHGVLPISFSWGTAEAYGRTLRDALDEADRNMYAFKRKRAGDREQPPAR